MTESVAAASMALSAVAAAVVGAWLLRWAYRAPKALAGLVAVLTLLAQSVQTLTGVSAVGFVDEVGVLLIVVIACLRRLLRHGSLRWFSALWMFLGFGALGILSAIVNDVPVGVIATGAFLFLKGPLLAFAVAQLDWRRSDIPVIIRGGAVGIIVILALTFLNALAPAAWSDVIARTEESSERAGFISLTGPFDHPVGLGTTMAMAFVAVLAHRSLLRRTTLSLVLLIGTGLACLLAFRRKSIASAIVTAAGLRAALPGPKAVYVTSLVLVAPILLAFTWDTVTQVVAATVEEYTADVNETARIRLTVDSIPLALGAFPLGVGFGRFASFAASQDYSPLYVELGYPRIYGMGRGEDGGYLSDTFWPAPLAETGLLGFACYLGGLFLLVLPAWRMMRRCADPHLRWIGSVVVGWFGLLMIESVVAPVFVSPPMYGLPFLLAGTALALTAEEPQELPARASATAPAQTREAVSC